MNGLAKMFRTALAKNSLAANEAYAKAAFWLQLASGIFGIHAKNYRSLVFPPR